MIVAINLMSSYLSKLCSARKWREEKEKKITKSEEKKTITEKSNDQMMKLKEKNKQMAQEFRLQQQQKTVHNSEVRAYYSVARARARTCNKKGKLKIDDKEYLRKC